MNFGSVCDDTENQTGSPMRICAAYDLDARQRSSGADVAGSCCGAGALTRSAILDYDSAPCPDPILSLAALSLTTESSRSWAVGEWVWSMKQRI